MNTAIVAITLAGLSLSLMDFIPSPSAWVWKRAYGPVRAPARAPERSADTGQRSRRLKSAIEKANLKLEEAGIARSASLFRPY